MNTYFGLTRPFLALALLSSWLACSTSVRAADVTSTIPAVIQAGFAAWSRGVPTALDILQKGGLMEGDRKVLAEVNYFKKLDGVLGAFKTYDLISLQKVSPLSEVVYLSMNFDRAVVYARFLLYRTEQDWVVQNMDFNIRPELIIPWMAIAGGASATE